MAGPVNPIAYGKPCLHCTTQLEGQADMGGLALCGRCCNGGDVLLQRFQLVVWIEGLGEWKAPASWPDSAAKKNAYQAALSLDACARRLQIQERLTRQVGELLAPYVLGVAVHVEAQHLCMMARGVSHQESTLVINCLTGPFWEEPKARAEFFAAIW
jgi:hypothetical protein